MIYIRRLWLAPTIIVTICIFFLFRYHWREQKLHYGYHHASIHLDPSTYERRHPLTSYTSLPSGTAKSIPPIQNDFSKTSETATERTLRLKRRDAVKESFEHAWRGYKKHAWMKDEVTPLSGNWRNSFGGWGATMVDTMDTLWLMGMRKDFEECVKAVAQIDFTSNTEDTLNVFETTIRYLGGLLAAYDLSEGKYSVLLEKAKELGELLYIPFDTPNHMPVARWTWERTAEGRGVGTAASYTLIAELGSLTLEFTRLSQLTGDPKYFDAVQRIALVMAENQSKTRMPGLWPTIVDAEHLEFRYNHFTLGGMVDSAYEYLPKQYLLLGGLDDLYKKMYKDAITTAKKWLFFRPLIPDESDILFSGNAATIYVNESTMDYPHEAQSQHLTCFLGGLVGIASRMFSIPEDLSVARKLVEGCIWAYSAVPSGLMPEVFSIAPCKIGLTSDDDDNEETACRWSDDKYFEAVALQQPYQEMTAGLTEVEAGKWWVRQKQIIRPFTDMTDNRYILRPEAIESIFILYRITGDKSLMDSAWTMFQAIEKATRTDVAHAGIEDVRFASASASSSSSSSSKQQPPPQLDRMESFWLAETLKYFYLIFEEPEVMSLDDWVLNTEAHPFRRPKTGEKLSAL